MIPTFSSDAMIAQTIQLALAPVFVLVAIGSIIATLTQRLGRVVDRSRELQSLHGQTSGAEHDMVVREIRSLDLRIALIGGPAETFSCVAGTMVQENFRSSAPIRAACRESILGNADLFTEDFAEAIALYGVDADPRSLSLHMQTVIQGAFILAKTQDDDDAAVTIAGDSLRHLKRYLELLFRKD